MAEREETLIRIKQNYKGLFCLKNLRMNLVLAFAIPMIRLKKMTIRLFYPISQNSLFINDEQIGFKIRMNYRENANKYRNF